MGLGSVAGEARNGSHASIVTAGLAAMPNDVHDLVVNRHRLRRAATLLRRDLERGQVENKIQAAMLTYFCEQAAEGDEPAQLAVEVLEREVSAVLGRFELQ